MLDLFQYDFMQRALLAMVAMSLFSPVLGIFLILRRQSLMSDTLSHVSLAGVAFGLFLGISPTLSTMIIVIIAAVFLEYLRTLFKDFMEIGTAILMSTGLALALVLMRGGGKSSMSLDQYLFGSTLTITDEQVIALFVIAFVVLVLTALFLRPMYILTFDEDTAFVDGLPVRTMSILFNVVTGVAIALMIPAAGSLLVSTIMVLPASSALKLGKNFRGVMLLAVIIGAVFLEYLRTLFKDFMGIGTAILMSTGLALALVLMRGGGKSSMSLDQYLFGSTLTITDEQVIALFVIAFVVLVLTALFLRPMYILTFDEDTAFVDGLPVRTMSILFNVVTGVAIALMIPAAGSLLVSTIMVLPASIALKLGKNFRGVMLIAVIIGFIGMFSGLILSYIADTPASASITLLFVALFLLVNLGSRLRK